MRRLFPLLVLLLGAADAPLRVHLTAPAGGWTSQRVVTIAGTVSDRRVAAVQVAMNGVARLVNARNGRFEARLPVRPGLNTVEAVVQGASGTARDRASFQARAPRTDLQVLLTWDTNGTDLDLRVTDPSGEECYHGNRRTAAGGVLEVDDTDGFGPEIFLLPAAPRGEYRVAVACYDSGAAPQTDATVEVIVREGTPDERRYRFPVTFTHEGDTVEVGGFFLDRALE